MELNSRQEWESICPSSRKQDGVHFECFYQRYRRIPKVKWIRTRDKAKCSKGSVESYIVWLFGKIKVDFTCKKVVLLERGKKYCWQIITESKESEKNQLLLLAWFYMCWVFFTTLWKQLFIFLLNYYNKHSTKCQWGKLLNSYPVITCG